MFINIVLVSLTCFNSSSFVRFVTEIIVVIFIIIFITFRVSHRRREMYCGRARLCVCVCLSVCLYVCPRLHAQTIAQTRM